MSVVMVLSLTPGCGGADNATVASAVVTTAVAATMWVAAGGCRAQGCPWGSFCDKQAGRCESRSCGEGCPAGSHCNHDLDRCEDMPSVIQMNPLPHQPPKGPNDVQPVPAPIPLDPTHDTL